MSKVSAILAAFSVGDAHTMTEIAKRAGLPISTAHRLLLELTSQGLLYRAPDGRFRVGLTLRVVGGRQNGTIPGIAERAQHVLADLSEATHRETRLGVLAGMAVAYIEKQPGHRPASMFADGRTLPAHATALGRAILAFSAPQLVDVLIRQGLPAYTSRTTTAPDKLRRALAITRLSRFALSRGELEPDHSAIASPVFGPGGEVAAAIEIRLCNTAVDMPALGPALAVAARSLSRELIQPVVPDCRSTGSLLLLSTCVVHKIISHNAGHHN